MIADIDTLCLKCKTINLEELRSGPMEHWTNTKQLKQSKDNGCNLCKLLWARITQGIPQSNIIAMENDDSTDSYLTISPNEFGTESVGLYYKYDEDNRGIGGDLQLFWKGQHDRFPKAGEREIAEDPSSPELVDRIMRWVKECTDTHQACGVGMPTEMPTRVIDVGSSDGSREPFLTFSNGNFGRYAALSYCWGLSESITTTADNIDAHLKSLPLEKLPRTLQDALRITRSLGLQYLWIDALCIVQARYKGDVEAIEDWQRESSKMAGVYANAWITIAAGEGTDKSSGILNSRTAMPSCQILEVSDIDESKKRKPIYARIAPPRNPVALDKRAWTLQESLLSVRVLEYRNEQVVLTCRSKTYSESGNEQKRSGIADIKGPMFFSPWDKSSYYPTERDLMLRRWYSGLMAYALRSITNDADKLPALSGLAHKCQEGIGGGYHAGLWQSDLINGLLWQCTIYGGSRLPASQIKHLVRTKEYRAPTWSWASTSGEIYFQFIREEFYKKFKGPRWPTEVLEVNTTPVGPYFDPLGQVSAGYVKLHGPIRTGSPLLNKDRKYRPKSGKHREAIHLLTDDRTAASSTSQIPYYEDQRIVACCHFDEEHGWPAVITCIQLIPNRGLLLKEATDTSARFERIGIFLLADEDWFVGCPNQEVIVV